MDDNGAMQYFHILSESGKKQELVSTTLFNGIEVLAVKSASGEKGLAPFHTKTSIVSGTEEAFASAETVDLTGVGGSEFGFTDENVALNLKNNGGAVEIEISEVTTDDLDITVFDHNGNTVYYKRPGTEFRSMSAKLDLKDQASDVFVLKVSTSTETKDYALVMR
jgi:hypothetical protein